MSYKNLLFFNKNGEQYNVGWNGSNWEGSVLFPKVSEELFEIEHIFIVEKFYDHLLNVKYGFPHNTPNTYGTSKWRVRWDSDFDGKIDVTQKIFIYDLLQDPSLDNPVLNLVSSVEIFPDEDQTESFSTPEGIRISNNINSSSAQINIALRSNEEGIYDRRMILEDISDPLNPVAILVLDFHGEVEGEDDRFSVLLSNFGRKFTESDSKILRETDPSEDLPDWLKINEKRKELLLEGDKIYSYIGSYKSLINAIRFFGYYDLRIKEYWLNLKADLNETQTPLEQNYNFIKTLGSQRSVENIENILEDENRGKYKQIEIYGKRKDGSYGLKEKYEELFPSASYKKTSLFGLFYDINRVNEDGLEDEFEYPIVENVFMFSPEEVILKLFGLKERLKRDYLPLNARIIDITGEGVYFGIYKTRSWTDQLKIDDIDLGIEVKFDVYPKNGYIEDLRPFYLRRNPDTLQYPVVDEVPLSPELSHYGNIIEPYTDLQEYRYPEMSSLIGAVRSFYNDIEFGKMPKFLGDGDYDFPGYKVFSTGKDYVFPAGCPVILTNTTFDLSWDDINGDWDGLNPEYPVNQLVVASYTSTSSPYPGFPLSIQYSSTSASIPVAKPSLISFYIQPGNDYFSPVGNEVLFVRAQNNLGSEFMFGYVMSGGYNTVTGQIDINVIYSSGSGTYSDWKIFPVNLTSSTYTYNWYQNFSNSGGTYSWDRIKYLDFYEIEWTISKDDEKPYFFTFRGKIDELEVIPHFLPYTGTYKVQCRVWDTLNSISLGIETSAIEVKSREIELNSITRFREAEKYDWNNTILSWNQYDSLWIWPIENKENLTDISTFISNFPEYSNNFNEGQICEVLTRKPEVRALADFDYTAEKKSIVQILSPGIGDYAEVETQAPHGYSVGNRVWIYDSSGSPYGLFIIRGIVSSTKFTIPVVVIPSIIGGYSYGEGNMKIFADGVKISDVDFNGTLDSFSALVYQSINYSATYPKYSIFTLKDSENNTGYKNLVVRAPNDTGKNWNGKILSIVTSGCISSISSSNLFSGGLNEREEYVEYDFSGIPPTTESSLWGTKNLSWNSFEDFEFDNAYSQTWDMYDYHNDWLGGFNLYSLQYGDRIKIGRETQGIVLGESDSPPNTYLDLREAADQLNSSNDPGISKFEYVVRNYSNLPFNFNIGGESISPDLSTLPGPRNVDYKIFDIPTFSSSPYTTSPTSLNWDINGDIWITGYDLVRFDGVNMDSFDSTNSPLPSTGMNTSFIKILDDGGKYIGVKSSQTPLIYWNERKPELNKVYSISDFIDNSGSVVLSSSIVDFNIMEHNPSTEDIFIAYTEYGSPGQNGLLFYCASEKSWKLHTPLNSGIPSGNIRDLKIKYYKDKWYLWIATDDGLSRFDGSIFKNYNSGNSGLPNDDVYSVEIDKLGHLWIGTLDNICYYDLNRWTVWNYLTNTELYPGKISEITETNNSNVWFVLDTGAPGNRTLYYFNGYNFTKYEFKQDLISPLSPSLMISAQWKTIKNGFTIFPKNIIFINDSELIFVDYIIPHIHAVPKFPGAEGYDFIYYEPSGSLPSLSYTSSWGDGYGNMNFNWSPGPLYDNVTLNSDSFRPDLINVDRYSWSKPIWQRYNIDHLKNRFPSLDLDHVFLYAPMRDIIDGKATNEYYWRNSPIEREESRAKNLLINDVEWIITVGDVNNDYLFSSVVDREGDVIAVGGFQGSVFVGEVNNISSQNIYLNSGNSGLNRSGLVSKYNSAGVLQWARSIDETLYNVSVYSVKTDLFDNIYVTGCYTNISTLNDEYVFIRKYSSNGAQVFSGVFANTSNGDIRSFDIELDKYENIYISGNFNGSISIGSQIFNSPGESVFIAKLDDSLNLIWMKTFDSVISGSNDFILMQDIFIYMTGTFSTSIDFDGNILTSPGSDAYLAKLNSGDGSVNWVKGFGATTASNSRIAMDPKGNIILTGSYSGSISSDGSQISSITNSLYILKFTPTGNPIWFKSTSGAASSGYDVISDSEEYVYVTGIYSGDISFSPDVLDSSGMDDIFLGKWDKDGVLVDIVSMGGINMDRGNSLSMDKNENIYLSGYFTGSGSQFSPFVTSSPQPGGSEGFLLKIPKTMYIKGNSMGNVTSWLGSHSWSWKDARLFKNEFEIPVGSTVFVNPMDSLIPGKKNHVWTLRDSSSGKVVIKVKKTPYFIYTFLRDGFYDISCEVEDANGNKAYVEHNGKIRVINHKRPDAEDLVPSIVNSSDYSYRSIYSYGNQNEDLFQIPVEIII